MTDTIKQKEIVMAIKKQYEEIAKVLEEKFPKAYASVLPLMEAKRGGASGEVVTLKDAEGNLLGRKCSFTGKWFPADRFYTGASVIKEVEKAKNKIYETAKKIEAEALELMKSARELNGEEKLAKFEEADAKSIEAETTRATAADVSVEFEGGFDTIEDLQSSL